MLENKAQVTRDCLFSSQIGVSKSAHATYVLVIGVLARNRLSERRLVLENPQSIYAALAIQGAGYSRIAILVGN